MLPYLHLFNNMFGKAFAHRSFIKHESDLI